VMFCVHMERAETNDLGAVIEPLIGWAYIGVSVGATLGNRYNHVTMLRYIATTLKFDADAAVISE